MAAFAPAPMMNNFVPSMEQLKAILANYNNSNATHPFQQNAIPCNTRNLVNQVFPQNKIFVSGFGKLWTFNLNTSVEQILSTIRGDMGNSSARLVLEAVSEGLRPVRYMHGARVTAVAEGWRLIVRCLERKPYAGVRICTLIDRDCSICGEGPRTKALLPCHHLMCEECAVHMSKIQKKCPVCHQWIKSSTMDVAEPYQPVDKEEEEDEAERDRKTKRARM